MERSISSIAEEIMATTTPIDPVNEVQDPVTGKVAPQLDIRNVEISSDDVSMFLGEGTEDPKPVKKSKKVVEFKEKAQPNEAVLLEQLQTLVGQLNTIISEMTSCGMLTVKQGGGKLADPMKDLETSYDETPSSPTKKKQSKKKRRRKSADEILRQLRPRKG